MKSEVRFFRGPVVYVQSSTKLSLSDPQGTIAIVKGVRFKVEFSRSSATTNGGYNTLVSLTQEKGAQSSFKSTYSYRSVQPFCESADGNILAIFAQLKQSIEATSPAQSRPRPSQVHSFTLPSAIRPQPSPMLAAPPMRWTTSAPTTPIVPSTPRLDGHQAPGSGQLPSAIRF